MFVVGRNGSTVHRHFGFEGLEDFQSVDVKQLGCVVFGGRDEHGSVLAGLHVVDVPVMVLRRRCDLVGLK